MSMTAISTNELSSLAKAVPLFALHQQSFTKADLSLANFIAQNPAAFLHMTIAELAQVTSLSEITISRFCKKLSLAGVQELKIKLAYLLAAANPPIAPAEFASAVNHNAPINATNVSGAGNTNDTCGTCGTAISADRDHSHESNQPALQLTAPAPANDSSLNIGTKIFAALTTGLKQTLKLIDFAAVEHATELINHSSRLMLFGYGSTAEVCKEFSSHFVRLGFSCETASDLHQQLTLASVCNAHTTVIVVASFDSSLPSSLPPCPYWGHLPRRPQRHCGLPDRKAKPHCHRHTSLSISLPPHPHWRHWLRWPQYITPAFEVLDTGYAYACSKDNKGHAYAAQPFSR